MHKIAAICLGLVLLATGAPASSKVFAPAGIITDKSPTFTWKPHPGTKKYILKVTPLGKGKARKRTLTPGKAGCAKPGKTCRTTIWVGKGDWRWSAAARDKRGKRQGLGTKRFTVTVANAAPASPAPPPETGGAEPDTGGPETVEPNSGLSGSLPYPPSQRIAGLQVDWSSYREMAHGSDNWPVTAAANGKVYTSWGDGGGFGEKATPAFYVGLGIGELTGIAARSITGRNLIGGKNPSIAQCFPDFPVATTEKRNHSICRNKGLNGKARGILALNNDLFLWMTPSSAMKGYEESRLYKAPIGTNNWRPASWAFSRGDGKHFIFPSFAQQGRNNAGPYVYSYAARYAPVKSKGLNIQGGPGGGEIHLIRASKSADLLERSAHQFFAGITNGRPRWSADAGQSKPIFKDANGVGWSVSATHVKEIGRWIMMTPHTDSMKSHLGIFEAPEPWGPWRTVFYDRLKKNGRVFNETFFYVVHPLSTRADGSFTLVLTGRKEMDLLAVVDARFVLK